MLATRSGESCLSVLLHRWLHDAQLVGLETCLAALLRMDAYELTSLARGLRESSSQRQLSEPFPLPLGQFSLSTRGADSGLGLDSGRLGDQPEDARRF